MADQLHVVPAQLREAAAHHEQVSDHLRTVPSSHAAIQESLDSLGPIFSDLREAGRDLLELRRQCYEQQADDHATLARNLRTAATAWDEHEQGAAHKLSDLGNLSDGGR